MKQAANSNEKGGGTSHTKREKERKKKNEQEWVTGKDKSFGRSIEEGAESRTTSHKNKTASRNGKKLEFQLES